MGEMILEQKITIYCYCARLLSENKKISVNRLFSQAYLKITQEFLKCVNIERLISCSLSSQPMTRDELILVSAVQLLYWVIVGDRSLNRTSTNLKYSTYKVN